jgi:hypothetical protein
MRCELLSAAALKHVSYPGVAGLYFVRADMACSGGYGLIKQCNRQFHSQSSLSSQLGSSPRPPGFIYAEEQITTVLYEQAIKPDEVFYCAVMSEPV